MGVDARDVALSLRSSKKPNALWRKFHESQIISTEARPYFSSSGPVFTMGSCFAEEIRKSLSARGFQCRPDYSRISFKTGGAIVDELPDRVHMNFYNTFSLLQEIQKVGGVWQQDPEDFWTLPGRRIEGGALSDGTGTVYQDPYRRRVFASSPASLRKIVRSIDKVISKGISQASVIVLTLGLTEVFVNKTSGKVVNQRPSYGGGGGELETELVLSGFEENLENMRELIRLLRILNPDARGVLSVSPVPLNRTFSGDDVVVANQRSKSILVAVAQQASAEAAGWDYFPSYEFVQMTGRAAFKEKDGRHVKPEVVDSIVSGFFDSATI